MNRKLLVREFLDEISQRADERFKGHLHQSFLQWYIEAEFGGDRWSFTDDASDGGIDAIVWRPNDIPPVVIVQSKFTEHVGGGRASRRAYRDFRRVVEAFYHREKDFNEFLSGVRDDLRRLYRRAFDLLTELIGTTRERPLGSLRQETGEFERSLTEFL